MAINRIICAYSTQMNSKFKKISIPVLMYSPTICDDGEKRCGTLINFEMENSVYF